MISRSRNIELLKRSKILHQQKISHQIKQRYKKSSRADGKLSGSLLHKW